MIPPDMLDRAAALEEKLRKVLESVVDLTTPDGRGRVLVELSVLLSLAAELAAESRMPDWTWRLWCSTSWALARARVRARRPPA